MVEYTTNPLTGRQIQVGGNTFNRLLVNGYEYIERRLVQRRNSPPIQRGHEYINVETGRWIQEGSSTFNLLLANDHQVYEHNNYRYIVPYYLIYYAQLEIRDNPRSPDMSLRNLRGLRDRRVRRENLEYRYIIAFESDSEAELAEVNRLIDIENELEDRREARRRIRMQQEAELDARRDAMRVRRDAMRVRRDAMRRIEAQMEAGSDDIDLVNLQENFPLTQANRDRMMDRLTELNIALCKECQMPYNPSELVDGLCKEC